jgi:hypothetical protein
MHTYTCTHIRMSCMHVYIIPASSISSSSPWFSHTWLHACIHITACMHVHIGWVYLNTARVYICIHTSTHTGSWWFSCSAPHITCLRIVSAYAYSSACNVRTACQRTAHGYVHACLYACMRFLTKTAPHSAAHFTGIRGCVATHARMHACMRLLCLRLYKYACMHEQTYPICYQLLAPDFTQALHNLQVPYCTGELEALPAILQTLAVRPPTCAASSLRVALFALLVKQHTPAPEPKASVWCVCECCMHDMSLGQIKHTSVFMYMCACMWIYTLHLYRTSHEHMNLI